MKEFYGHGMGFVPSPADPRDFRMVMGAGKSLPEEWMPERETEVHDQGQINSCAAHALASCLEEKLGDKVSFGWYYGDRRHTDHKGEGLIARDLLKTAQKDGVPLLPKFPHDDEMQVIMQKFEAEAARLLPEAQTRRIGTYTRLYSADECRRAMFEGKAVLLGLYLFDNFKEVSRENPVMPVPPESDHLDAIGGHMVRAYGWKKGALRARNSWGKDWGEDGNFYIPDSLFQWSEKNGFPIEIVEAWAVNLDGVAPEDKGPDGWYKQGGSWRYRLNGEDQTGWVLDRNYGITWTKMAIWSPDGSR